MTSELYTGFISGINGYEQCLILVPWVIDFHGKSTSVNPMLISNGRLRSPAGVLRALGRVAQYIEDGKELHLSGVELMASAKRYDTPYKGYRPLSK